MGGFGVRVLGFRMYSMPMWQGWSRPKTTLKIRREQGSTRLPTIADVPYLDVVAAINSSGNKLTLFCVNRHLTRDIETRINLSGFRPKNSTARSLFANSIYEKNDETEPEHIHPMITSLDVESAELKYTFRHESVTVIELGR